MEQTIEETTSAERITTDSKNETSPSQNAYCELDIVEKYRRRHRTKGAHHKSSELSKKIKDLAERNQQIEKMTKGQLQNCYKIDEAEETVRERRRKRSKHEKRDHQYPKEENKERVIKNNEKCVEDYQKDEIVNGPPLIPSHSEFISLFNYIGNTEEERKIITVFENINHIAETDSLPSRNTTSKKSRTTSDSIEKALRRKHKEELKRKDFEKVAEVSPEKNFAKTKRSRSLVIEDFRNSTDTSPRRELSFSNLNIKPLSVPPKIAATQTALPVIQTRGTSPKDDPPPQGLPQKLKAPPVISQTTLALRDIFKVHELEQLMSASRKVQQQNMINNSRMPSGVRPKIGNSFSSSSSTKSCLSKNSKFHTSKIKTANERIVEISSKISNQEEVSFTVEGVEPPRKISPIDGRRSLRTTNLFTVKVFPGIAVNLDNTDTHNHGVSRNPSVQSSRPGDNLKEDKGKEMGEVPSGYHSLETKKKHSKKDEMSFATHKNYKKPKVSLGKKKIKSNSVKNISEKKPKEIPSVDKIDGSKINEEKSKDMCIQTDEKFSDGPSKEIKFSTDSIAQTQRTFDVSTSPLGSLTKCSPISKVSQTINNLFEKTKTAVEAPKKLTSLPKVSENHSKSDSNMLNIEPKTYSCKLQGNADPLKQSPEISKKLKKACHNKFTNTEATIKKDKKVQIIAQKKRSSYSRSCSPLPSQKSVAKCNAAISAHSIKLSDNARKVKSKQVVIRDDHLVNNEMFQRKHEEIAALEKCLNKILTKLASDVGEIKEECQKNLPKVKNYDLKSYKKKARDGPDNKSSSKASKTYRRFRGRSSSVESSNFISKTFSKDSTDHIPLSPLVLRSVFKSSRTFLSSASSLSSKFSDLPAETSNSIPLLDRKRPKRNKKAIAKVKSSTDLELKRSIVKKKHKIMKKMRPISKKKSNSILDMLKKYIYLSESQTFKDTLSKVIILSVSSAKFRGTRVNDSNGLLTTSWLTAKKIDDSDQAEVSDFPKETTGAIRKEPFFMNTTDNSNSVETATDSLETVSNQPKPCPLTALFNFEPPNHSYFVYNAEIITTQKPKLPERVSVIDEAMQEARGSSGNQLQSHSNSIQGISEDSFPRDDHPRMLENMTTFAEIARNVNATRCSTNQTINLYNSPKKPESMEKESLRKYTANRNLTTFTNQHNECNNLIFNYVSNLEECEERTTNTSGYFSKGSHFNDDDFNYKVYAAQEILPLPKIRKSSSFRNFFRKGNSLLEIFRSGKSSGIRKFDDSSTSNLGKIDERTSSRSFDLKDAKHPQIWFNFVRKKKRDSQMPCDPWCANRKANDADIAVQCREVCHKNKKCMTTSACSLKDKCPCKMTYEDQAQQCRRFDDEDRLEEVVRKKRYLKQYENFDEMPLAELRNSKACPCKKLHQNCKESYILKNAAIQVKEGRKISQQVEEEDIETSLSFMQIKDEEKPDVGHIEERAKEVGWCADGGARGNLTDSEIFEKLLTNFERKEAIAAKLSNDERFFQEQILASVSIGTDDMLGTQVRRRDTRTLSTLHQVSINDDDCTVKPDDIGTCFARGFRPDNLMLSGDACFHLNKQDKIKMSPHMLKHTESIIDFSERDTPLDFLLALGFMVDEASNALKDEDIRSRLLAAITEARVWINKITSTQGTLLYLVAYKARPETMRYFLQLVEAIINKRINNAIKLDGFLRVLEEVEEGKLQMINILGEDKFEDEENEEKVVKTQLKNLFINVYNIAEKEAFDLGKALSNHQINLLRILVAKYRAGLHPHLELIARYIGQGLLDSIIQLEAAMIFLSRLDTAEVKLKEFENYCGIKCIHPNLPQRN